MFAALLTFGFVASAIFALASIGVSLKRGLTASKNLRRELASCTDTRLLTISSMPSGYGATALRQVTPERGSRRTVRRRELPARRRQLVAA